MHIVVVEINGDEELKDPSDENRAEYQAAVEHFARVNESVDDQIYTFYFLRQKTMTSFSNFFAKNL